MPEILGFSPYFLLYLISHRPIKPLNYIQTPVSYTHLDVYKRQAFMNSFDWRNASDLEKATRICNRIHQASYDHDAANEADTTGWSNSCLLYTSRCV